MSENKNNNISISGAGNIDGGHYNNITISGTCKVKDDIKANRISISGSSKFLGNVDCETISVSGTCKIDGNIKMSSARISGVFRCLGAEGTHLRASGVVVFEDDINFEIVEIDIVHGVEAKFKNIYGEQIIIRSNSYLGAVIEEIEATKIDIEVVRAQRVSGENVILGPGCVIDVVEYSKTLEMDRNIKVNNIIKI